MALIQCPECNRDVSTNAEACPHCGNPKLISTQRHLPEHLSDGPHHPGRQQKPSRQAVPLSGNIDLNRRIQDELMPGEHVLYQAKLHFSTLIGPMLVAGFMLLCLLGQIIAVGNMANAQQANASTPTLGLCSICGVLPALIWLTYAYFRLKSTMYILTNKRIISDSGVFNRQISELPLSKIENVALKQGFLDQRFNRGTLLVRGTGVGTQFFKNIIDPLGFRKAIQSHIQKQF